MNPLPSLAAGLSLLAGPVLAEVRTVGIGGDYADVQAAVDASSDGDLIVVKAGFYPAFKIVDKSLWVTAETPHSVLIGGQIRVSGLAPTKAVVLVGFDTQGQFPNEADLMSAGLNLFNNAGAVRLERCSFSGAAGGNWGGRVGAWITECTNVTAVGCIFRGGDAPNLATAAEDPPCGCDCSNGVDGGSGILATNSEVVLYDSYAEGGKGGSGDYVAGEGADGFRTFDSSVLFASGSIFVGGVGGKNYDCLCITPGGPGGAGIRTQGAAVARGIGNTMIGGVGGPGPILPLQGPAGPSVAGVFDHLSGTNRTLQFPSPATEGATVNAIAGGVASDHAFLAASSGPAFLYFESFRGYLLIDALAPSVVLVDLGTLPPAGALTTPITLPTLPPALEGISYYLQGLFLDGSFNLFLGSPEHLAILRAGL